MKLQWMNEKDAIDKSRNVKEKLEKARFEQEKYEREGNLPLKNSRRKLQVIMMVKKKPNHF